MRIISGSNKGKKLIMPNDKVTRPLKDMAKESIFNILAHSKYINFRIKDSKVLEPERKPKPRRLYAYKTPFQRIQESRTESRCKT